MLENYLKVIKYHYIKLHFQTKFLRKYIFSIFDDEKKKCLVMRYLKSKCMSDKRESYHRYIINVSYYLNHIAVNVFFYDVF